MSSLKKAFEAGCLTVYPSGSKFIDNEFDQYIRSKGNVTGIFAIDKERGEQLNKHRYSVLRDCQYKNGELENAAIFCITKDDDYWPCGWDEKYKWKILEKSEPDRLAVAGALLAARIDVLIVQSEGRLINKILI